MTAFDGWVIVVANRGEMPMTDLSSDLRETLARVGTSTLTGVLNRRGLRSMTLFDVRPLRSDQPRLVGIAFTMRFIPSREDKDGPSSTNRSTIQPQAMEECPPDTILDRVARHPGSLIKARTITLFAPVAKLVHRDSLGLVKFLETPGMPEDI